jgi:hypothetical protein
VSLKLYKLKKNYHFIFDLTKRGEPRNRSPFFNLEVGKKLIKTENKTTRNRCCGFGFGFTGSTCFLGLMDQDPQRYGSGSFYNYANIVRKTLISTVL